MNKTTMQMQSLYDYLGYAACMEEGERVYTVAKSLKINVDTRIIETNTYKGKVMLYPTYFLDFYYKALPCIKAPTLSKNYI